MKQIRFLLIFLLISLNWTTSNYAQIRKPIRFEISSLNDKVFIATGLYIGELQIYNEFVEIKLDKTIINIQDFPNHKGIPFIKNITAGLGKQLENGQWDIYSKSLSYKVDKQMNLKESYQLPILYFLIPRDPNIDLKNSWIIMTIEINNIIDGNSGPTETCYTHSRKDIFKVNQIITGQ